jgi:putative endonuclease
MHFLYIIYSPSKNTYYIGETHNIDERLIKHREHSYYGSFTKIANDWVTVLNYACSSKNDALFLEAFIKRMKSKKFIIKVIENPTILTDILLNR